MAYRLGNGIFFCFWKDIWLKQVPLGVCFPKIFCCCDDPDVLVHEVIRSNGLALSFRRSFGPDEVGEWQQLQCMLEHVSLSASADEGFWSLTKKSELYF